MPTIDDMIARLRAVEPNIKGALPEIAGELRRILVENIAASRAPDGTPWPATQDGRAALSRAAEALTVQVVGGTVLATLDGPEARHSLGLVKGKVRRQILPDKGIPAPVVEAIGRVLTRHLRG